MPQKYKSKEQIRENFPLTCIEVPYNQDYWWALYLTIYSKNAIDGILNWWFWLLYGKKSMVIV